MTIVESIVKKHIGETDVAQKINTIDFSSDWLPSTPEAAMGLWTYGRLVFLRLIKAEKGKEQNELD